MNILLDVRNRWTEYESAEPSALFKGALEKVAYRTLLNIERFGGQFPYVGQGNEYELTDNRTWVSGYWTAWLWMMFHQTGDTRFYDAADRHYNAYNERFHKEFIHCHDIGVIYDLAAVRGFAVTKEKKWRNLAVRAAAVLTTRFNENGRFLRAWGLPGEYNENTGRTIIDSLCCTPLWYWAAKTLEDEQYTKLAKVQSETVMNYLVRPDNSSGHSYLFHPETGEPIGIRTFQGYADESTWSRGQAWGIQGFPVAYAYTGDERFLQTAIRMLEWFVEQLGDHIIPAWDFSQPNSERDTSALALAANGLLRIAVLEQVDNESREACRSLAVKFMTALIRLHGTLHDDEAWGLLRDGVYHMKGGRGISEFMIWGDYYFIENLMILAGNNPLHLEA